MSHFWRYQDLLGDEWWWSLIRGGIALLFLFRFRHAGSDDRHAGSVVCRLSAGRQHCRVLLGTSCFSLPRQHAPLPRSRYKSRSWLGPGLSYIGTAARPGTTSGPEWRC